MIPRVPQLLPSTSYLIYSLILILLIFSLAIFRLLWVPQLKQLQIQLLRSEMRLLAILIRFYSCLKAFGSFRKTFRYSVSMSNFDFTLLELKKSWSFTTRRPIFEPRGMFVISQNVSGILFIVPVSEEPLSWATIFLAIIYLYWWMLTMVFCSFAGVMQTSPKANTFSYVLFESLPCYSVNSANGCLLVT